MLIGLPLPTITPNRASEAVGIGLIADFSLYLPGTIIFQGLVAFALWLACYTQEEIAELMNTPKMTVSDTLKTCTDLETLPDSYKVAADHLVDFTPPIPFLTLPANLQ